MKRWLIASSTLLFFCLGNQVYGQTNDELYSEINNNGDFIDGNKEELPQDKPVIRPTYLGKSLIKDVIGPDGEFKGFWGEQPSVINPDDYYGHQYLAGKKTIIQKCGYYNGQSIALKVEYTLAKLHPFKKVTLEREGGLTISPDEFGVEFRLVYDDGQYNTPVENVYVEFPILNFPTAYNNVLNKFSESRIKTSNLIRLIFNDSKNRKITNVVSRERYSFLSTQGKPYEADSLHVLHKFYKDQVTGSNLADVSQTIVFDNNQPMVFAEYKSMGIVSPSTLFKSELKTPFEINYLPPRTNGSQNTEKFVADFDITQALNDGYPKNFPDSLSVVMVDHEKKFNSLHLSTVKVTDKKGKDMSPYIEIASHGDHEIVFTIKKKDLINLGSNQLNIELSVDNLNSQKVLEGYDEARGVYLVPMTFYNQKTTADENTPSEKMIATAEIIPNVYGEPEEGIEAPQYTTSGDLVAKALVKNVATTIPGDSVQISLVNPLIQFNEVKVYDIAVKISSTSLKSKMVSVPVTITEAVIVTSDYLENQKWLIDEVNRQLAPKKIDKDVYLSDLWKITEIVDTDATRQYKGQHIPKTISSFNKLERLELADKELAGTLPTELGTLTHLQRLLVSGNQLKGAIPESLGALSNLTLLDLERNNLSGVIPKSLSQLKALRELTVASNQLVGDIPTFPNKQLTKYDVSYSQVTFNDGQSPTFMSKPEEYDQTFIVKNPANNGPPYDEWTLKGRASLEVVVDQTVIKPFDSSNRGFFNLHARTAVGSASARLFSTHRYTIISQKNHQVVYDGLADPSVELVVDVAESFEIIMDGATKNPNNRFVIKGTPRDLSIIGIPASLSLKLTTDNVDLQPVELSSQAGLKIRDNRLNSKWQLKVRPSELASAEHVLKGHYLYMNDGSRPIELPVGIYKGIQEGKSNPNTEFIDVTAEWNQRCGLLYQTVASNYKGEYRGQLDWQIVDAPMIEPEDQK